MIKSKGEVTGQFFKWNVEDYDFDSKPFDGNPIYKDKSVYSKVERDFMENISSFPGVVSIYSYGTLSDPGLQDIDLVTVVDHYCDVKEVEKEIERFYKMKPHKYLIDFPHIMNKENFKLFSYYVDFKNFKLIHGEEIELPEKENPELFELADQINRVFKNHPKEQILFLNDRLHYRNKIHRIVSIVTDFLGLKGMKPRIKIMSCLRRLKTLRTSIRIIRKGNLTFKEKFFIKELNDLRGNWLSIEKGERERRLIELLKHSVVVGGELQLVLEEKLEEVNMEDYAEVLNRRLEFISKNNSFVRKHGLMKKHLWDYDIKDEK